MKKNINLKLIVSSLAIFLCIFASAQVPKYVFYFIGDGMGFNHVEAALLYQSKHVADNTPSLIFTEFPVTGIIGTRSASDYITDSSAGGTALATGFKANNTEVGIDSENKPVYSIIYKVQKQGWQTGVITSTSIDDATPSSFYAHKKNRNAYYEIGKMAATSGINFLGGGGFKAYTNKQKSNDPHLLNILANNRYRVYKGMNDYVQHKSFKENVVLIPQHENPPYSALPYAIDRQPEDLSLEQLTASAIEYFKKSKAPRFILVAEGGRIDHASHPNDGATVIHEVIDFSKSVKLAYDFYLEHPQETLIVLTADHETGGLGLGNYDLNLNIQLLSNQRVSLTTLSSLINKLTLQKTDTVRWENIVQLLKDNLGFWKEVPISAQDEMKLKEHYIKTFIEKNDSKVVTFYANDEPLAVTSIEIINRMSQLGWTTTSHSGAPVPVYAIGVGSEQFTGMIDNTDIPRRLQKIIALSDSVIF